MSNTQQTPEEGTMRAKIRAERIDGGYRMVAIRPDTDVAEYPQEGRVHRTRQSVYTDAAIMYSDPVWAYNASTHTIEID
jgi:hypothetical protein